MEIIDSSKVLETAIGHLHLIRTQLAIIRLLSLTITKTAVGLSVKVYLVIIIFHCQIIISLIKFQAIVEVVRALEQNQFFTWHCVNLSKIFFLHIVQNAASKQVRLKAPRQLLCVL
jgi:hypothetical protein